MVVVVVVVVVEAVSAVVETAWSHELRLVGLGEKCKW